MACGCKRREVSQFLWYKDEASEPIVYSSEIQAKAKVIRQGGKYIQYDPSIPVGAQISIAESVPT